MICICHVIEERATCPPRFAVMFTDVIADVLLGTSDIPGILPDLFAGSPTWLRRTLLNRPLFLVLLTAFVVAPISLQRHMGSLSSLNVAGLVAVTSLGLSLVWLSVSAVIRGTAHDMPLWPNIKALSGGAAGTDIASQVRALQGVCGYLILHCSHSSMHSDWVLLVIEAAHINHRFWQCCLWCL